MTEVEYPIAVLMYVLFGGFAIALVVEMVLDMRDCLHSHRQTTRYRKGVCPGCGYQVKKGRGGCSECGWGYNWWGP